MASIPKYHSAWKYDGVSWGGLAAANAMLMAAKMPHSNVLHALAVRTFLDSDEMSMPKYVAGEAAKRAGIKANEVQHTGLEDFGEEWVGIAYAGVYWEDVNARSRVLPLIEVVQIPQGANRMRIPVETESPSFYRIPESTAAANIGYTTLTAQTSRVGTAMRDAVVAKRGAAVTWTGEMDEDSVVNFGDAVRMLLAKEGAHVMDDILINADSETGTTNINNDGTALDDNDVRLDFDGFRKFALSDAAYQQDVAGSLGPANIARILRITGSDSADMDDLKVIVPIRSHESLLTTDTGSDRVNVFDFLRREMGQWSVLGGYEYIPTPDFTRGSVLTASTGNVSATDSDNTRLSAIAVRPDQWIVGNKRSVQVEVERRPRADAYELTLLKRISLAYRSGSTTAAAIAFNAA